MSNFRCLSRILLLSVAALCTSLPALPQSAPGPAALTTPAPGTKPVMAETIDAAVVRANAGLDRLLPKRAETVYQALAKRFQPARAMEVVTFMDRYWRVAGQHGLQRVARSHPAGAAGRRIPDGKADGACQPARGSRNTRTAATAGNSVRAEMTIVEAAVGQGARASVRPGRRLHRALA